MSESHPSTVAPQKTRLSGLLSHWLTTKEDPNNNRLLLHGCSVTWKADHICIEYFSITCPAACPTPGPRLHVGTRSQLLSLSMLVCDLAGMVQKGVGADHDDRQSH